MDDEALIERCRRGDRQAQRALYERHVDRVYRLALRLTANPHDASDITQDSFVRAFEHIGEFAGRSRIDTWLYRITTNLALQLFRRNKRERTHHARIAAERPSEVQPPEPLGGASTPDIEPAMSLLPPNQRAILILRYYQNMSYHEIADVLGIAPGTVASRLNRARIALRTLLGEESPTPREETPRISHPTR